MTRAEKICKALEDLADCCEKVKEVGQCEGCPMKIWCLDEELALDVALGAGTALVADFIEYAEKAEPEYTKDDYEADRGNLERCDPDDF